MANTALYDGLSQKLRGPVVRPGDDEYDQYRRVWNRDVDRYPAAIARCLDEEDVQTAVRFAAEFDVGDVAVRGGGHSYPGLSTCDDGLVIDLGLLQAGRVLADNRVALQGGATLGHLDALTAKIGTAVPAGVEATTGIAGLTLGGGIGSLQRRFGMTCDNLRSVHMVAADGSIVVADDKTEADLMWGLRGGGGNFGVVTEFEFQSHPVGTHISNFYIFPLETLSEFSRFFDEFVTELPKEVAQCGIIPKLTPEMAQTMRGVGSTTMPSGLPTGGQGEFFAVTALWVGDPDAMATVLRPLESWRPIAHISQPITHLEMQSLRPEFGVPQHRYVRGGYLSGVGSGVLEDCAAMVNEGRPEVSSFVFTAMGGAIAEVGEQDTAFNGRSAKYLYAIEASWFDSSERDSTISWVRDAYDAIERHATGGGYINTVTDEGSGDAQGMRGAPPRQERVRRVFGDEKFARLQELKSAWDPGNLFHMNVNIPPASRPAASSRSS